MSLQRKRPRIECNAEELPWKKIRRPFEIGLGGDNNILELEEVEGVEVIYTTTDEGKVAKFCVVEERGSVKTLPETGDPKGDDIEEIDPPETITFNSALLPEWTSYSLHPKLLHILHKKDFTTPTPIQAAVLPLASKNRDIIGVAQTGSGKTLAYGLPILNQLLSQPRPHPRRRRPVQALILVPTRELALQVSSHLNEYLNPLDKDDTSSQNNQEAKPGKKKTKGESEGKGEVRPVPPKKPPPHVSVAAIVGGMSNQKHHRILDRGVDVLVATPGRLWDITQDDDNLAKEIKNLRFIVLDEADRMIESGHFNELENILRLTLRENSDDEKPIDYPSRTSDTNDDDRNLSASSGLQTFVLSATLSKDLQRNLKKRTWPKPNKKRRNQDDNSSTLDDLLLRLDFRDPEPSIIDLSPQGNVVPTLREAKIECLTNHKDVYLYYFLLRHPGRSLVFLSSIDGIRRLMPLLERLAIKVFPLHSQLEQRQRLKNLDRFKTIPNAVLLATDIAARGLDIPAVDHVIHFQIPRTADTYIHRSGRTARAENKGFSMLMIGPDERRIIRVLLASLARDENEIAEFSVELSVLDQLKARVQLARQIEQNQHKAKKAKFEKNWMKETAEALGVDLDPDYMNDSDLENQTNRRRRINDAEVQNLENQLKRMLAQPLVARGISTRYITSGSRPIAADLLAGETHETLLGLTKAEAGSDVVLKKGRKCKNKQKGSVIHVAERGKE